MGYKIKCIKCDNILMQATGKSTCFMTAGSILGCQKCGNSFVFDEDINLESEESAIRVDRGSS